MKIKFLGGANEVGRSCVALETDESCVLVDCGLKQGEKTEYPTLNDLERIDSIILTHAHIDHAGGIPLLAKRGLIDEKTNLYCTPPTASLMKVLLWDSFKLQRAEWEEEGRSPLYGDEDVREVLDRIRTVPYQSFSVTEDIEAELGNSGHILGSAWVRLRAGGRSILVSGDLGEGRSNHLQPAAPSKKSDILIIESTYGDTRQHPSYSDECRKLSEIASEEKPILIPTFAIGRSFEVLRLLKTNEKIDSKRIVYDGMIDDVFPIYRSFASDIYMSRSLVNSIKQSGDPRPFLPNGSKMPSTVRKRKRIISDEESPIIVSPSGMLQGGWSPFYLNELVEKRDDARVVLVGHQVEGTVGNRLAQAAGSENEVEVTISALMGPENANEDVEKFGFHDRKIEVPSEWIEVRKGFSAHASANSLLEFARMVLPRRTFIVHGDEDNANSLRRILSEDSSLKHSELIVPDVGDEFEIEEIVSRGLKSRIEELEDRVSKLEQKG